VVDFALSRMLGLYVVARLAQRYRIKVQLRHSWYGGITALVLLPPNVVVRTVLESLEAGPRRGRAELVPSTQPVEPPAAPSGDHLPIFEAARSDWFESGSRGDHLPLRRHAAQQPSGRTAEPAGNGAGAGNLGSAGGGRVVTPGQGLDGPPGAAPGAAPAGPASPPPWTDPVPPVPPAPAVPPIAEPGRGQDAPEPIRAEADHATAASGEPPRMEAAAPSMGKPPAAGPLPTRTPGASVPPTAPPPTSPPSRRARHERGGGQPPPAPVDMPTPAPSLQTTSVQTTKAGLPRRVPRANLAPGMVAARTAAAVRPADTTGPQGETSSPSRSPEEVRSMLSSYRSGLERGRMMAAGEDAVTGSDAPSSARSDDDATQ
jgi:hypothetical protein